jgi:hypothetical protein
LKRRAASSLISIAPLGAILCLPCGASAQGPVGPEFQINTYVPGDQQYPSIAADDDGDFVVVWRSTLQDGAALGVFGQRYNAIGAPLGPEFRVNSYTTDSETSPAIASDGSGDFVVVWHQSVGQDGSSAGVFGQRYDGSGAPLGAEFQVNTFTTGPQYGPDVASDTAGNFVVVWTSAQDGSGNGVMAQRYASSGAPLGPEFLVNTYTTGEQYGGHVSSDSAGNFVVVWASSGQDGSNYGVFGQRFASTGAPIGPEFRVNSYTTSYQNRPFVASDSSGDFVVVWRSNLQDGSSLGVFGQRYASSGAPLGVEFRVNTYTTSAQFHPVVAADSAGNFVVAWHGYQQESGSSLAVFAQRFDSSGTPSGPEFRVNTFTPGHQFAPSVAADSSGKFVIAWTSEQQDGSARGVFGQRYRPIVPVELMRFGIE